jgi:hypothetical protein
MEATNIIAVIYIIWTIAYVCMSWNFWKKEVPMLLTIICPMMIAGLALLNLLTGRVKWNEINS